MYIYNSFPQPQSFPYFTISTQQNNLSGVFALPTTMRLSNRLLVCSPLHSLFRSNRVLFICVALIFVFALLRVCYHMLICYTTLKRSCLFRLKAISITTSTIEFVRQFFPQIIICRDILNIIDAPHFHGDWKCGAKDT